MLLSTISLASTRLSILEQAGTENFRLLAMLEQAAKAEERFTARCERTVSLGEMAPLEYLFRSFALTEFERHCVRMSLAADLDISFENRLVEQQGTDCHFPTLSLCLNTYSTSPDHRLMLLQEWRQRADYLSFFFRVVVPPPGATQTSLFLMLHRRVVDFVLNFSESDPALDGFTTLCMPRAVVDAPLVLRNGLVQQLTSYLDTSQSSPLLFHLWGEAGSGRKTVAHHMVASMGLPLLLAHVPSILDSWDEDIWLPRLIAVCRECIMRRAVLALHGFEWLTPTEEPPKLEQGVQTDASQQQGLQERMIRQLLAKLALYCPTLIVISEAPWPTQTSTGDYQRVDVALELPSVEERIALWHHLLDDISEKEDLNISALAVKFALQPGQIQAATQEAFHLVRWESAGQLTSDILHRACRKQLAHSLGKMASRVNVSYTWEDLILPPIQKRQLESACAQVELQHQVYDKWGFAQKVAYGRGVSMLFTGPPGTGKTMAAQVIANRLHLELYKVDLSGVLSKYIGETEKQLGLVFDQVKKSQSILFFDEADALFGKRSETKDAHDKYANVQTSYLLQKIEEYEGIVILASNYLQNFDEAFKRRLKFIVDFTLPDAPRREQIWRSIIPVELPLDEEIDFEFLARSYELSGSSIKNIAVAASFLAAQDGTGVSMAHLLLSTQREQQKTGKTFGKEEFGEYHHQVLMYQKLIGE